MFATTPCDLVFSSTQDLALHGITVIETEDTVVAVGLAMGEPSRSTSTSGSQLLSYPKEIRNQNQDEKKTLPHCHIILAHNNAVMIRNPIAVLYSRFKMTRLH